MDLQAGDERDNEKGYIIFCHLKIAEQMFEQHKHFDDIPQYLICYFFFGDCGIVHIFRIVNKNVFDFLENGSDSHFLCLYSDDGCGHFVTISCFMAVHNQRQVFPS